MQIGDGLAISGAKSNQGGIETREYVSHSRPKQRAKSNQGGIETATDTTALSETRRAKSNQGGIETKKGGRLHVAHHIGKIEPRWD